MIRKRYFLISILLSAIVGWTGGFLRLPYIDKNFSFFLGFLSALALSILILIFSGYFKKNKIVWTALTVFILLGSLLSLFLMDRHNATLKVQILEQEQEIEKQLQLIESSRKSKLVVLLKDIFDEIDQALKSDPKRSLSNEILNRIDALNYSFTPYSIVMGDSLSVKKWSPERGQLLVGLASRNIDSSSFNQIKRSVSFLGAYLKNADLKGIDLSGIDLKNANLIEADLSDTNLSNSNLSDADLWGTNLSYTNLENSILHRADLRWADLSESILIRADVNGANLNDAKLGKSNMREINMEWTKSRNTYLSNSDLSGANLTGTDLANANLMNANFSNANMHLVNFSGAILDQTILSGSKLSKATVVESDWIKKLKYKNVVGAKQIEKSYKTVVEVSGKYNYRLVMK